MTRRRRSVVRDGMPQWVRNLVMLVALAVWAAWMLNALVRGIQVDAIAWGVPGAVYLALNPPRIPWPTGDREDREEPDEPAPTGRAGGAS